MILTRVGRSHRNGLHSGRKAGRLSCFARGSFVIGSCPIVATGGYAILIFRCLLQPRIKEILRSMVAALWPIQPIDLHSIAGGVDMVACVLGRRADHGAEEQAESLNVRMAGGCRVLNDSVVIIDRGNSALGGRRRYEDEPETIADTEIRRLRGSRRKMRPQFAAYARFGRRRRYSRPAQAAGRRATIGALRAKWRVGGRAADTGPKPPVVTGLSLAVCSGFGSAFWRRVRRWQHEPTRDRTRRCIAS